jgi:glycosyltransferase involved in cell wall biosynthesis
MAEKIRILHIIKSLGRGGAEMLLPETLRLHNRDRFDFHYIYFLPWKDQMVEAIRECGGRVTCIPANNNLQLLLKTRSVVRYVRENKIQLVHAHLPWAGVVARIVGKLTGVPVIYSEHNKQERYHGLTRWMNLATMNWLYAVVPVSGDVEESIRKNKKELTTEVHTILNGVNMERFAPGYPGGQEIRRQLQIPNDAPVIGTIAVFRFQKRLDLWMELAGQILNKIPTAHFIIVGDGPLKEMLVEKRRQLGLKQRVHFAGLQTEVRPYLACFDIYMMSSVFEGLPIALLETMSSGCPPVTTDAGGIKEVVRHDIDGLVCSVDEPHKLVDYTVALITDPTKRKSLAAQSRSRIGESFSMKKMVNELEDLYGKVTGM